MIFRDHELAYIGERRSGSANRTHAQRLELPTGARIYSTGDLKQTAQRLSEYGARFLSQDEIADQLPLYPEPITELTQVNTKRS